MDPSKLRAWLSHKQGLDGTLQDHSAADVLHRSGLAVAAFYYFLASMEDDGVGSHLASGLLLGLAIAAKYNAAFLLPLWIGRDLIERRAHWKRKIWAANPPSVRKV